MIYQIIIALLLLASTAHAADFDRDSFGNFQKGVRGAVAQRQSEIRIRCAYTNEVVPIEATSLDHIVSLREAWEYGAYTWPSSVVKEFYNDTDNLVLVLPGINSQKGSRKKWLPKENVEWYIGKRKQICGKYGLDCPDYGDN